MEVGNLVWLFRCPDLLVDFDQQRLEDGSGLVAEFDIIEDIFEVERFSFSVSRGFIPSSSAMTTTSRPPHR